ncbi:phosphate-regulating neutral endopeptidase PHEX-like [Dermacentor albipictus]|uniref:phosphate-regulating neutral endopeptidase PHEX-like n=1 Tax=Dermacentor albipictus TaxID=60249 RepID=UPI0031FC7934
MDNRTINRPFSYLRPNTPMPIRNFERAVLPSGQRLPEPGCAVGAEITPGEARATVPSAQCIASPPHSPVDNGVAAAPQTAGIRVANVPSTKTSPIGTAPSKVARPLSDLKTGRAAALAENFGASKVPPVGSTSTLRSLSGSSSSSSSSEGDSDDGEDDDDGAERSTGRTAARSQDALRYTGRSWVPLIFTKWKDLSVKEISAQTLMLAVVSALIISYVAMMVVEALSESRDHHGDGGSESQQPTEAIAVYGKSGGVVAQGRAAAAVATSSPASSTATRRKALSLSDYDDYEAKVTGDPLPSPGAYDCDTEACRWQIRLVDEKLNATVNPCVDFYSYVCSQAWELHGDLPYRAAGKAFLIKEVTRYLLDHMRALRTAVAESVGPGEQRNFLDHSSIVLSLCLGKTVVAKGDAMWDSIQGMLRDVGLEGWPYVDSPLPFQLDHVLRLIDRQLAVFPIVYVSLRKASDTGPYVLHVDAPREFLLVQYEMQKGSESLPYKEIVRRTLTLWKSLPRSNAMATDVVQFEAQLLEASKPAYSGAWEDKVFRTVKNFPPLPMFRVDAYLLHLRGRPNDSVVVLRPSYFNKLPSVMRKSSPQTILNFLGVRVVVHVAPLLSPAKLPQDLLRMGYPSFQHTVDPRTQSCFHLVNRLFPHGFRWILREIVAKTTDLDLQWAATVRHAMSSLARTFRTGTSWMESEDLSNTLKWLRVLRVDYLAGKESRKKIDRYYAIANTTYYTDNLVGYYGRLLATSLQRYWDSSNEGANYDARFDGRSTDLDAAWTRSLESNFTIYLKSSGVASGSLVTRADLPSTLYPLLSLDVSRALLLSSLDETRWSSWSRDRFGALRSCLVERYKSAIQAANIPLPKNSVNDLFEQIFADNAVIKPLMVAFRRFSHGVPFVPGRAATKLTALKLFFINYAAGFCATKSEAMHAREHMRYRLSLPPRVRVNLALLDLKEFRDAFCPKQPTTTPCPVWNDDADGSTWDSRRRGLRRNLDKTGKR